MYIQCILCCNYIYNCALKRLATIQWLTMITKTSFTYGHTGVCNTSPIKGYEHTGISKTQQLCSYKVIAIVTIQCQ